MSTNILITLLILISVALVWSVVWVSCLRNDVRNHVAENDRLRGVVRGLANDHRDMDDLVKRLEKENTSLRSDNDTLRGSLNIACSLADDGEEDEDERPVRHAAPEMVAGQYWRLQ